MRAKDLPHTSIGSMSASTFSLPHTHTSSILHRVWRFTKWMQNEWADDDSGRDGERRRWIRLRWIFFLLLRFTSQRSFSSFAIFFSSVILFIFVVNVEWNWKYVFSLCLSSIVCECECVGVEPMCMFIVEMVWRGFWVFFIELFISHANIDELMTIGKIDGTNNFILANIFLLLLRQSIDA